MDDKILKQLESEISGNPEYQEMEKRLEELLKRYGVQKYDPDGKTLFALFDRAKKYGIDFVESVIVNTFESRQNSAPNTLLKLLPGKLTTALMNTQRVEFISVYEGPLFAYSAKESSGMQNKELRGKTVLILIDNEMYSIVVKHNKVDMPFLPYHKYVGYGNFTKRNNERFFYLNSYLPVTDKGEVNESSMTSNIEEIMANGRPRVYQYSDLIDIISRNKDASFFMKAYVEKVEERKNARLAYLILLSGFDLPQDRPISLLVGNDISAEDELLIVGSVNQNNTWNDEIQLSAKLVYPIKTGVGYNFQEPESPPEPAFTAESPLTKEQPKSTEEHPTPSAAVAKETPEKPASKEKSKDTEHDARIDAILRSTMNPEDEQSYFG